MFDEDISECELKGRFSRRLGRVGRADVSEAAGIDGAIAPDLPQSSRKFMHSLPVANIFILESPEEKYVGQGLLNVRLRKRSRSGKVLSTSCRMTLLVSRVV